MSMIPYTFRVIRYVHDPAVGEMLNIGVILYAPEQHFLAFRFAPAYGRLSETFVNFDGDGYRRTIARLEAAFGRAAQDIEPGLFGPFADLEEVTRFVMPDTGGSFLPGPVLAGITPNLDDEVALVFDRMVLSQSSPTARQRRSDDDVWSTYQRSIPQEAKRHLHEKTFETNDFEQTFPHAFKNERWHILAPISMDYADPGGIQRKAVDWLGCGVALSGHPDLSKIYLLLGQPQNDGHRKRYNRAKDLLSKMAVRHEIVEEDEAVDFGREIAGYMREHGLIEIGDGELAE